MESAFLRDWAIVLSVAAAMTLLCRWLKQPVVIGYLLAGLIIGPHTPPFSLIHDIHSIHTMAELGLVVLMFVLGLEFSLPKLRQVGKRAALAATLEIFGMLGIGYLLGRMLGWGVNDSIYLGAILSISSTTIIIKVLSDLKLNKDEFAQAVFGILILEDIAAVVILTVLSGLGVRQADQGFTVLRALLGVGFFVAVFLIIGLIIVPRLLRWIARFKSAEMAGLTAFGLCLTSALLAEHFGFSVALGAFLIGAIIGVCPEVETIEEWFHPIRDFFSALFFVSAGLLIDPKLLWEIRGPVAIITVATIVGKMLTGAVGSFFAGYSLQTSSRIGMTLAQIGEFSFVFASLGLKTGLASDFLYPLAVAVSALTTLVTPYLIRFSDSAVATMLRAAPPRFTHALERYSDRMREKKTASASAKLLSRYGTRLGIYAVLIIAGFLFTKALNTGLLSEQADAWWSVSLWAVAWIIHLPLIYAAIRYINHFFLLALTDWSVRSGAGRFLQKIPIQSAYHLMEALIWTLAAVLWAWQPAYPVSGSSSITVGLIALTALRLILGRSIQTAYEKLESLLDEILGRASSEPLRQAVVTVGHADSSLNESIRRVVVLKGSPAASKSLRELRLREKTGASVIGIYSHGKLNANPAPDTELKPNDILVLLGDPGECDRAEELLSN